MDEVFKQSVKLQTFQLHAMDMMAGFTNIPYVFYFENANKERSFMTTDQLKESFYLALAEFPILAGNLVVHGDSSAAIVVEKTNLNMPEFLESEYDICFEELKRARFSWDHLPSNFITVDTIPKPGQDDVLKLVNVHIGRLRENSGVVLFVSIPHYPVDGVGYCAFVNRWASICKHIQNGGSAQTSLPSFGFDRSIIGNSLPTNRRALDEMTQNLYAKNSFSAGLLARLSPERRGLILSSLSRLEDIKGHVFHLSAASLTTLHSLVRKEVDPAIRISDNDVITALVSMVVAQGVNAANMANDSILSRIFQYAKSTMDFFFNLGATNSASKWLTSVVVDSRVRLSHITSANYTGNAVLAAFVSTDFEQMLTHNTDKSLALVARQIRHAVSRMDGPSMASVVDIVKHNHQSYARALANTMFISNKVVVSNQSRFNLYPVDFGGGCPAWISPIPSFYANFASILPRSSKADGYYIYITTSTSAMDHVLNNELWTKWVQLVY